jgi:BirA family biotin operon repressor/biotin-[acetyl-CoA-carboxylase] ligase
MRGPEISGRMDIFLQTATEEPLCAEVVRQGLQTRWLGKHSVLVFERLDSTNSKAKQIALQGAVEGTVVVAETQTEGRGRLGRRWISPHGAGLYFSIVLRPRTAPTRLPLLTLTAGVAVAAALGSMGVRPGLKWPNDILLADKKVGGILTEGVFNRQKHEAIILGIGLNVNTPQEGLSDALKDLATSVQQHVGGPVSRIWLLHAVLERVEYWYGLFCDNRFDAVLEAWSEFDTTTGRQVEVNLPHARLVGTADRVCSDGTLLVRDSGGEIHRIVAGDIVHCRVQGVG